MRVYGLGIRVEVLLDLPCESCTPSLLHSSCQFEASMATRAPEPSSQEEDDSDRWSSFRTEVEDEHQEDLKQLDQWMFLCIPDADAAAAFSKIGVGIIANNIPLWSLYDPYVSWIWPAILSRHSRWSGAADVWGDGVFRLEVHIQISQECQSNHTGTR